MACHFRFLSGLFKVIMQATRKKVSYLENFSAYIRNNTTDNYNGLPNELKQKNFHKPHGRQPYSASMIWYALHLRYTSLQMSRLLLEKFPIVSLPILDKIQQADVDALKALMLVHEKGSFSCDCILMMKCICKNLHSINQESTKE